MSLAFDDTEYPEPSAALRTDTLVDSVLILLALTAVQRLVGFVRAVLFCRWLNAEQLGLWDMTFSFLLLAAPLSVLAIPGTFGRYLEHYRQRGQIRTFLRRTLVACGGLAVIAFVAVVLMRRWLSLLVFGTDEQSDMIAVAAGCLLAVIANNFLVELFTALRNIRLVSFLQFVNGVAFAVLGVGLLLSWRCSAESVLVSYGGACVITAVMAGFSLRQVWRASPSAPTPLPRGVLWARVAPFAAWVLLGSILTNLFGVVDRYMILHFSTMKSAEALDAVGNYYAARVVPLLLASVASMLGTMITPHLSHDWEAGRHDRVAERLRLFLKVFGFALFAAGAAVLAGAPLLFGVAFHGKFSEGQAVLPWALMYCTWFGLSLIAQNYLLCAEKARLASVALAAGLALNIPLNLVLLPRLGLAGAVLSTTAANAVLLTLICRFNHRLGFHLDGGARLVLLLPLLFCLGPWPAIAAVVVVAAGAVWSDRLLSPDEKLLLARRLSAYVKLFGPKRWFVKPDAA